MLFLILFALAFNGPVLAAAQQTAPPVCDPAGPLVDRWVEVHFPLWGHTYAGAGRFTPPPFAGFSAISTRFFIRISGETRPRLGRAHTRSGPAGIRAGILSRSRDPSPRPPKIPALAALDPEPPFTRNFFPARKSSRRAMGRPKFRQLRSDPAESGRNFAEIGGLISSSSSRAGDMKPGPSSGSCDPGHRPGLPGDIPGRTVKPLRLISSPQGRRSDRQHPRTRPGIRPAWALSVAHAAPETGQQSEPCPAGNGRSEPPGRPCGPLQCPGI